MVSSVVQIPAKKNRQVGCQAHKPHPAPYPPGGRAGRSFKAKAQGDIGDGCGHSCIAQKPKQPFIRFLYPYV